MFVENIFVRMRSLWLVWCHKHYRAKTRPHTKNKRLHHEKLGFQTWLVNVECREQLRLTLFTASTW